jgi:homogentisate phytyltransferase/homogentisate geranylgeranyltransferase
MGMTQGVVETGAVAAGLAVGAAYSLPPLRLKRYPVAASLCISGVRSIVVNLGVYWHFAGRIDPPVWALCAFVLPFSLAIAVLKDVPDIEGDRAFAIRTFTVRLGPSRSSGSAWRAADALRGMILIAPPLLRDTCQSVRASRRARRGRGACCCTGRSANPRYHTNSRASTCGSGRSSFWSTCSCRSLPDA